MTSEKKPKSKPNNRQRTARDQPAGDAPAAGPTVEKQPEAPTWHEQAAFHVTLDHLSDATGTMFWQTHGYHEETGAECVLPGIFDQAVIGWMRERAGLPTETPVDPASEPSPEMLAAPRVEIGLSAGALEVIELPSERQADGEEISARLCAQVTFELAGPRVCGTTADLRSYAIQVMALDLQDAKSVPLASLRRDLQPDLLGYSEMLDLGVPPVGSYQLIANVVLSDDDAAVVALGPVLNVVP